MRNRLNLLALSLFLLASAAATHAGQCEAYFTFDGNLQDASGNAYHGEMIGKGGDPSGAPSFVSGKHGQALRLDGRSAVRAPVDLFPESCPQLTITAWVYVESDDGREHTLISNGDGAAVRLTHTRKLLTARGGRSTVRSTGGALPANRWTFVAGAWDFTTGNLTLSWQGRQETTAMNVSNLRDPAQSLWIGAFNDSLMWPASGVLIDDVRVIGRTLTAGELRTVMRETPERIANTQSVPGQPGVYAGNDGRLDKASPLLMDSLPPGTDGVVDKASPLLEDSLPPGVVGVADKASPLLEDRLPPGTDGVADKASPLLMDAPSGIPTTNQVTTPADLLKEPAQPTAQQVAAATGADAGGEFVTQRQALESGDPAPTLRLNDEVVRYSDVSGSRGAADYRVIVQLPKSAYVTDVLLGEVDDVPCFAELWGEYLTSDNSTTAEADECGGKTTIATPPVLRKPQVFGGSLEAITGMKVCTNDRNDRVKGVIIRRRTIEPDGRLTNANDTVEIESANCGRNEWRSWAECPTGAVTVGMNAYFIPGVFPRPDVMQLTGIELRCAMVEVEVG